MTITYDDLEKIWQSIVRIDAALLKIDKGEPIMLGPIRKNLRVIRWVLGMKKPADPAVGAEIDQ